jgi:hypothetical protein
MNEVYEFYLELRDSSPKIWRKIQLNPKMTVAEFAYMTLVLFEMQASHLFKITVPVGEMQVEKYRKLTGDSFDEKQFLKEHPDLSSIRYRYELLDIIDDFPRRENDIIYNVTKEKLKDAISKIGDMMELWYDFGDDWFVDIKLTEIHKINESTTLAVVLDGKGFGIIEDCGGVMMLNDIIKSYKSKKSKLYLEIKDWIGIDDFDFSLFDIEKMNKRLQVIPTIYKRSYEQKKAPTDSEIDYIERN